MGNIDKHIRCAQYSDVHRSGRFLGCENQDAYEDIRWRDGLDRCKTAGTKCNGGSETRALIHAISEIGIHSWIITALT